MILIHKKITIVTMENEVESETNIYGRRSAGKCKCVQQPDTHSYLLWNLGNSLFLSYHLLIRSVYDTQELLNFKLEWWWYASSCQD